MTTETPLEGPAWDIESEYAAPDAARIDEHLDELTSIFDRIESLNPALIAVMPDTETLEPADAANAIAAARKIHRLEILAQRLRANLDVYARCLLSIDARDAGAQRLTARLEAFAKRGAQLSQPLEQFLVRIPDRCAEVFLADPETGQARYLIGRQRERRHELLSLPEEQLVSAIAQDGILAWGRLYDQISGTARVTLEENGAQRSLGLAEASSRMQQPNPAVREAAWRAIGDTWSVHEESCAAAVNAIAGWRLELCRRRSGQREVHFLDAPLHMNRISRATLDALLTAATNARPLAQRAASAMALATGRTRIGPWDNRAPGPYADGENHPVPFDEAVDIIAGACGTVDGRIADFVRMMARNRWIEGRVAPSKRPGAYCTMFPLQREPRVYMSYAGTPSDIITLAHELGHAFHGWVMRDLPDTRRTYGASVAETASTFAETVIRDNMLSQAIEPAAELRIAWEEITAFVAFLLNIPTRYTFEKRFYERRCDGPVRPDDLRSMMADAWLEWYGESISEPDPMFWASKLHFYISGLSFYNFPYLFGYLFSTAVHQHAGSWGDDLFARYTALLRDTGSMDTEQLAKIHLDANLGDPAFWSGVIERFEPRVAHFERLAGERASNWL